MTRDSYDDEIAMYCETCGEDFTIEGYVEDISNGEVRLIPAERHGDMCPEDPGVYDIDIYGKPYLIGPDHDVSFSGYGGAV